MKAISGQPAYPPLTIGGLLLARRRARALSQPLGASEQTRLLKLETEVEAIQARWRVAWENKAGYEFTARLTLWRDFMEDYRREPAEHADRYSYEVNRRVMLHLLAGQGASLPAEELDLLAVLDRVLRALLPEGAFVWHPSLQSSFPVEPFWYLYCQP